MIPAASAVSSVFIVLALSGRRLSPRSRYSGPLPGMENSREAFSLSQNEMGRVWSSHGY